MFLQKNHSYTRHFSCLRQHWKQAAVLSIVRWVSFYFILFLTPWRARELMLCMKCKRREFSEESRQASNTETSCRGLCAGFGKGQLPSWMSLSSVVWLKHANRSVRRYWVNTEKYPGLFIPLMLVVVKMWVSSCNTSFSVQSHCLFSVLLRQLFSSSLEDRGDQQFGVKLSHSCQLSPSLTITTNIGFEEQQFSFLNVQIFINYQNVNFRDQKQMQITVSFCCFVVWNMKHGLGKPASTYVLCGCVFTSLFFCLHWMSLKKLK